jgi:hypothetical protein
MVHRVTYVVAALMLMSVSAMGWGGYEHTIIAYAAQDHLTENAARNIRYYLDQPIYEYAEWMDWTPMQGYDGYEITRTGHCSVMWSDGTIARTAAVEDGEGDGFGWMEKVISTMKNHRELPDSLVTLHLRCFIHMMGDFHCPGHVVIVDKPEAGTAVPVEVWKANLIWEKIYYETTANKKTIHWLWDTPLQHMHQDWNFEQWKQELDTWSPEQRQKAVEGTLDDWLIDNSQRAREVFAFSKPGTMYSETYYTGRAREITYLQMRLAIYRMAEVLNACFDYEK